MRVNLAHLKPEGSRFTGGLELGTLDFAADDPLFAETGKIHFDIVAQAVSDSLLVRGRVWTTLRAFCVRCRETFEQEARDNEFFADFQLEAEVEEVDLTPEMREAILLALPSHPVCRESCRGLCPACGADRNRQACDCSPEPDVRWTALDKLKDL